ncbi:MAG TPA: hypothetical protein VH062_20015 [Polyangiaceae bacterium]|jgi:hypothetical protein|nr:hypothetical protein [Polyangiaceae bacterium]
MPADLGDDIVEALNALVNTADTLFGAYRPEFSLGYWSGVAEGAEAWSCTFEGDIRGDDGDRFFVTGHTAAEVLRRASDEAWRRAPPAP